jgi:hypothetical protein
VGLSLHHFSCDAGAFLEAIRSGADPDAVICRAPAFIAAGGYGQRAGTGSRRFSHHGRHVHRTAGQILAPIDDAAGIDQVRDPVVAAGPEIVKERDKSGRIAQRASGAAGAEEPKKKLVGLFEHTFGTLAVKMENGGGLGSQAVDLFGAKIQRVIPGNGLPVVCGSDHGLNDPLGMPQPSGQAFDFGAGEAGGDGMIGVAANF